MLVNKRLFQMTAGHRGRLAGVTALLCITTASYWLQAWFLAQALAALVVLVRVPGNPDGGMDGPLVPYLAGVLACGLGRLVIQQFHARLASSLGSGVRLQVRRKLADSLLQPERLRDTSDRGGARRLALSEGVDGVDSYISQYIPHAFQLQIVVPALLVWIAWLNPLVALALALAVAVAVGAPKLWGKALAKRGKQHWDSYEALSADFLEALQGMRTLKILHAVPRTRARLHHRSQELHRATVSTMRTSLVDTAVADFGIQAGMLAAAALAAFAALGQGPLPGPETAAITYFLLMLSSEVFRPVRDLARQWHAGYLGLSALGSIDAVGGADTRGGRTLSGEGQARSAPGSLSAPGVRPGVVPPGRLTLQNVSFRYSAADPWVLRDASAEIQPGGLTALAGVSGAGKSTLFDLLLGFLPAGEGRIRLDGQPLRPSDVSVVSQRSYLFPGTIRENLRAVAPAATEEEIQRVVEIAGLAEELRQWPQGLDTVLSEGGGSVSGGQLQRLSIARALLVDRPVLLLDEPTSALNTELAGRVLEGLRREAGRRIVLMIAHRPEALAAADTVLRLAHGQLHTQQQEAATL
ncbi:ABC transporter ATP-binding protein/permease [Paenarthrobacter aurescens]|uniref:ABC transporter ATP-binding protein/permease n=1 Tax=Paenarthrobacter aurescens TaxID=43663 RepID=UPI0021BE2955|nr:ATP-binding cassette domain-containing protein [Paenarthrobacter aurescens]MCT9872138.1 ATP-binding cassette domain-containing protein [Paenarthrobacter aurescens]